MLMGSPQTSRDLLFGGWVLLPLNERESMERYVNVGDELMRGIWLCWSLGKLVIIINWVG